MVRKLMAATVIVGEFAAPAWAGGTWLELDKDSYQPGERAIATADVSQGTLGWVDDGPFYAYLDKANSVPATSGLPLGQLQLDPLTDNNVRVTLDFQVPDVAPGVYAIVYCNDPCTNGLGDLIGGEITVTASILPSTGLTAAPAAAVATALMMVGAWALAVSKDRPTTDQTT